MISTNSIAKCDLITGSDECREELMDEEEEKERWRNDMKEKGVKDSVTVNTGV